MYIFCLNLKNTIQNKNLFRKVEQLLNYVKKTLCLAINLPLQKGIGELKY